MNLKLENISDNRDYYCPYCGKILKFLGSSSGGSNRYYEYRCDCDSYPKFFSYSSYTASFREYSQRQFSIDFMFCEKLKMLK